MSPFRRAIFLLHREKINNLEVFHHDCFTNHVVYADLIFDMPHIEETELPYVQLLLTLLAELGTGERDYAANLEYTHLHTGGIGSSAALYVQTSNLRAMKPCITLRGKSLVRKADKLFTLLKDFSTSLRLDETKRIEHLIQQLYNSMHSRITRNALRYAIQVSLSGFSTSSYINELWSGIQYYQSIRQLATQLPTQLNPIIDKLVSLKNRLFSTKNPHLILCCEESIFRELQQKDFYGLTDLPAHNDQIWTPHYTLAPVQSHARAIASPVAFTCEAYNTINYLHPHAPALSVSTFLMDNKILHPQVREKGGAYGVGAHYSPMAGQFYFHSYSDPHIARTLHSFHEAIQRFATVKAHTEDLTEAILGMIQKLDAPIPPGSRALAAYSWWREGKTLAMRQNYREKILNLTAQDIQTAVAEQLLPQKEKGVLVTLADNALLEKENALFAKAGQPLPIRPLA
jgi:presequence protease